MEKKQSVDDKSLSEEFLGNCEQNNFTWIQVR